MDTSYKDYFTATTLNAFQLTSGGVGEIDPNEKLALIGEEASLSFGKTNVSVDYKKYDYDIAGSANYYGGKVAYTGAQSNGSGLAYHRMDGETKRPPVQRISPVHLRKDPEDRRHGGRADDQLRYGDQRRGRTLTP